MYLEDFSLNLLKKENPSFFKFSKAYCFFLQILTVREFLHKSSIWMHLVLLVKKVNEKISFWYL